MPCYGPLIGYYSRELNPSGKRSIVFDKMKSHSGIPIQVPCGQCIGCRLERSRVWAVRCMHEKRMHSDSAFLTLTYDNAHLPPDGSLKLRDLQLFMKRLRKERPAGLRFYACGEYGETTFRPHYHVLLLNTDFSDRKFYKNSGSGEPLYHSSELSNLWPMGHHSIGNVTFESAAYCARYILKKQTGPDSDEYYQGVTKPFVTMSRRPGIAMAWFEKYQAEAFKHDNVIVNGSPQSLNRFYDSKYEVLDPARLAVIKQARRLRAKSHKEDSTKQRLFVRERFEMLKNERFKRDV